MSKNRDSVVNPDSTMERRRSLRLQEKEIEKAKKARMSSSSSQEVVWPPIQDSPLFTPEMADILPKIINNMDPLSFLRFAKTCKAMNYVCFNDKTIQKIPCWDGINGYGIVRVGPDPVNGGVLIKLREFSADSEFVKKLSKKPFLYRVELEISATVDDRLLRELRNYFTHFPHVVIGLLRQYNEVQDWEGLVDFMKDFRIDTFYCFGELPLESLPFFTQNLSYFNYYFRTPPTDDIILRATAKYLSLLGARISRETFKELIKKFVAGEIFSWTIGREIPIDWANGPDPFIEAVSEVMKVVQVKYISRIGKKPSTAYFIPSRTFPTFYIRKSDGSLTSFTVRAAHVSFQSR